MPALVRIRLGHSPDPDDAFMFWALTTDLVDTHGHEFEQVLADIQTLNQWARAARLEVTALSLAARSSGLAACPYHLYCPARLALGSASAAPRATQ